MPGGARRGLQGLPQRRGRRRGLRWYAYLDQFPAGERDATIRDSLVEVYRTYAQMADRASMFATLEVRVPFLDRCLVDAAVTLPSGARYRDGLNKRALRELYPGLLPQRIRLRPKEGMNQGAGFGTNDPGSSIYYAAVERHYAHHPVAARNDLEQARRHGDGYGVNLNDIREIYNFSRYIRLEFHRLEPDRPRPQLNVSTLRERQARPGVPDMNEIRDRRAHPHEIYPSRRGL